eukprot:gnl/TRDRNA2_/TRDRNA2_154174_c0_seq8.p1 gnl/TRDRNA2_/TRDRNA2_154174_c0~~gnl/TRDRNA2_/TRDRNA2_154174_c0_seq8.p1  ORF type:complete len:244 (+),score=40.79 gnl/TRDRNA2_/TRDRNA2_154174_c0_seq8:64-732(+)
MDAAESPVREELDFNLSNCITTPPPPDADDDASSLQPLSARGELEEHEHRADPALRRALASLDEARRKQPDIDAFSIERFLPAPPPSGHDGGNAGVARSSRGARGEHFSLDNIMAAAMMWRGPGMPTDASRSTSPGGSTPMASSRNSTSCGSGGAATPATAGSPEAGAMRPVPPRAPPAPAGLLPRRNGSVGTRPLVNSARGRRVQAAAAAAYHDLGMYTAR